MVIEDHNELAAKALSRCRDLRTLDVWLVVQLDNRLKPLGSLARNYVRLWSRSPEYREALTQWVAANGDGLALSCFLRSEEQRYHWDAIAKRTEENAARLSSLVEDVFSKWNRRVLLTEAPRHLFKRLAGDVAVSRKVATADLIRALIPELPEEKDHSTAQRALEHVVKLADRDALWKKCLAKHDAPERDALVYGWTDADARHLAGLIGGEQNIAERARAMRLAESLPERCLKAEALSALRKLVDGVVLKPPRRLPEDPSTERRASWILMRRADPIDIPRFQRWFGSHGAGLLPCMARVGVDVVPLLEQEVRHAEPNRRYYAGIMINSHYWKYACAYFAGRDLRLPNTVEINLRLARAILSANRRTKKSVRVPYQSLLVLLRDDLNRPPVRLKPAEYAELAATLLQTLKTREENRSEYAFYLLEALDRPEFDPVYRQLESWPTAPSQHRSWIVREAAKKNTELARLVLAAREATKNR